MHEKYEPDVSIVFHFTDVYLFVEIVCSLLVVDFFFRSRNRFPLFNGAIVMENRIKERIVVGGDQ
jgi:hypothetical protein